MRWAVAVVLAVGSLGCRGTTGVPMCTPPDTTGWRPEVTLVGGDTVTVTLVPVVVQECWYE